MRSIAVALCMAALAGAGVVGVKTGERAISDHDQRYRDAAGKPNDPWRNLTADEANADLEGAEVCNCKIGGECDCVDCQCEDCPCKIPAVKDSLTAEEQRIGAYHNPNISAWVAEDQFGNEADGRTEEEAIERVRRMRPMPKAPRESVAVDPVTGMAVGGPAIVQLSTSGCLPCIRWEAEEKPKYLRQGWEVPAPVYGAAASAYPTFRIYDGKRWHQHTGWLTGDDMRRILGGGTASSSNPRASAGAAVVRDPAAAAVSFGRDWLIGGQPWTRQSLINHLATHSSHGHSRASLQAMSLDQLNALHNADHESHRSPMRSTVMSSCPGGSCPPQSYSSPRRRGLFGGWR